MKFNKTSNILILLLSSCTYFYLFKPHFETLEYLLMILMSFVLYVGIYVLKGIINIILSKPFGFRVGGIIIFNHIILFNSKIKFRKCYDEEKMLGFILLYPKGEIKTAKIKPLIKYFSYVNVLLIIISIVMIRNFSNMYVDILSYALLLSSLCFFVNNRVLLYSNDKELIRGFSNEGKRVVYDYLLALRCFNNEDDIFKYSKYDIDDISNPLINRIMLIRYYITLDEALLRRMYNRLNKTIKEDTINRLFFEIATRNKETEALDSYYNMNLIDKFKNKKRLESIESNKKFKFRFKYNSSPIKKVLIASIMLVYLSIFSMVITFDFKPIFRKNSVYSFGNILSSEYTTLDTSLELENINDTYKVSLVSNVKSSSNASLLVDGYSGDTYIDSTQVFGKVYYYSGNSIDESKMHLTDYLNPLTKFYKYTVRTSGNIQIENEGFIIFNEEVIERGNFIQVSDSIEFYSTSDSVKIMDENNLEVTNVIKEEDKEEYIYNIILNELDYKETDGYLLYNFLTENFNEYNRFWNFDDYLRNLKMDLIEYSICIVLDFDDSKEEYSFKYESDKIYFNTENYISFGDRDLELIVTNSYINGFRNTYSYDSYDTIKLSEVLDKIKQDKYIKHNRSIMVVKIYLIISIVTGAYVITKKVLFLTLKSKI